jgi:hypothetical protein
MAKNEPVEHGSDRLFPSASNLGHGFELKARVFIGTAFVFPKSNRSALALSELETHATMTPNDITLYRKQLRSCGDKGFRESESDDHRHRAAPNRHSSVAPRDRWRTFR